MENKEPWKIKLSNENNVSLEDVKFIFSQAEKKLADTIQIEQTISTKTTTLLTFINGLLVLLCGYVIMQWNGTSNIDPKVITAFTSVTYIFLVFGYMVKNIFPNGYSVPGSSPKELFVNDFFTDSIPENKRTIYVYMSEIESYEKRIKFNQDVNTARWAKYIVSLIAMALLPLVMAIIYLLMVIL